MTEEKKRILVVDDTFTNRFLLRELIKKTGHLYLEAENGKQGIEVIEEKKPHLVFLDIEMPVMNGFETLDFMRNELPSPLNSTPVVAITAHDPEIFCDEFRSHHFQALLTKPFSSNKIIELINQFCS